MQDKKQTILAIGGHVGDMELTAGGVLAAHCVKGASIVTLAMTAGEKGAPAGRDFRDYRAQKVSEAETFARMLGGEAIVFDYPDGLLPDSDEARFKVCDVIRDIKPDVIITHFGNSIHKDHVNTHRIVNDAWFYAANTFFERCKPAHFAPKLYYAENWEDAAGFKPYLYIDVTEGYDLWQKAVSTHWFVTGSKDFPYLEYYSLLSRLRGIEARKSRAQCFSVPPETMKIVRDSL